MLCESEGMTAAAAASEWWQQMMTGKLLIPTPAPTTAAASNGGGAADGPRVDEKQQLSGSGNPQLMTASLRCPRCDSTNTKFCYYNNYSLSQPRHFCKACKRYWTRGGTLRNVPVGGGCRKNKRVKKPTPTSTPTSSSSTTSGISQLPTPNQLNVNGGCADLNPLLYGLNSATTTSDVNLGLLGMQNYHLQSQMSGLGFSFNSDQHNSEEEYHSGFTDQLQPSAAAAALWNNYSDIFSSSAAGAASLLVSSLKQPKRIDDYCQSFSSYHPQPSMITANLDAVKEVKIENETEKVMMNRPLISWQLSGNNNPYDAIAAAAATTVITSDASNFNHWNNPAIGAAAWPDAANCGSSLAPLF